MGWTRTYADFVVNNLLNLINPTWKGVISSENILYSRWWCWWWSFPIFSWYLTNYVIKLKRVENFCWSLTTWVLAYSPLPAFKYTGSADLCELVDFYSLSLSTIHRALGAVFFLLKSYFLISSHFHFHFPFFLLHSNFPLRILRVNVFGLQLFHRQLHLCTAIRLCCPLPSCLPALSPLHNVARGWAWRWRIRLKLIEWSWPGELWRYQSRIEERNVNRMMQEREIHG